MRHARSLELADLLVNTTGLTGFPTAEHVFARYALASKWAESAGASLRVAMVARAELIDPQKIGVLMAQNRGVTGDVFTTEAAAIAWLDARNRARLRLFPRCREVAFAHVALRYFPRTSAAPFRGVDC